MPDVILQSVGTDGNFWVKFVTAIADTTAPKLATEINAASSKDITLSATADGWNPGTDQAAATDSRLSARQDYQQPGKVSETLSLTYVINPQNPTQDVTRLALVETTTGFITTRRGKTRETPWAVGDLVDVRPVTGGVQVDIAPEANSQFKVQQGFYITGPVRRLVALAA